jgi:hypothetical protein
MYIILYRGGACLAAFCVTCWAGARLRVVLSTGRLRGMSPVTARNDRFALSQRTFAGPHSNDAYAPKTATGLDINKRQKADLAITSARTRH